jgi:hypothetical protein
MALRRNPPQHSTAQRCTQGVTRVHTHLRVEGALRARGEQLGFDGALNRLHNVLHVQKAHLRGGVTLLGLGYDALA